MSNIFRDSTIGFKPRANIFSKLRGKDATHDSDNLSVSESSDIRTSLCAKLDVTPNSFSQKVDTRGLVESTPETKHSNSRNLKLGYEEEELEITEVRCVDKNAKEISESLRTIKPKIACQEAGETSTNDVLLEAFTNTQRICSNLKQELQRQKVENHDQKQQITNYKTEVSKINERLIQYQQFLTSIEEKSKYLQQQKTNDEAAMKELKSSYEKLLNKVKGYSVDCQNLKQNLENWKTNCKNSEYELSKNAKELEYLKKELNICSGHLSEEKIRNSDLLQELKESREQSKEVLEQVIRNIERDIKKELKSVSILVSAEKTSNGRISKEIANISKTTFQISSILNKNHISQVSEETAHFQEHLENLINDVRTRFDDAIQKINPKIPDTDTIHKTLSAISKALDDSHILDINAKLAEPVIILKPLIGEVLNSLTVISKNIKASEDRAKKASKHELTVSSLQEQIQSHILRNDELKAILEKKDEQIASLSKIVSEKGCIIDDVNEKVLELNEKLVCKTDALDKLSSELSMAHTSFEGKFAAQKEILRITTEDRDGLRVKIAKIQENKEVSDREIDTAKLRAQNVNEQLQKLNVEVVQSKARELELDEDNRNLRNLVDQLNLDARESADLLRGLKCRVSSLEGDKRSSADEKLELHDKITALEHQLQTARKHVQDLKDQRHKIPQVKKIAEDTQKTSRKGERQEGDAFDLSSSNDDLELTNPSPIQIKHVKGKKGTHGLKQSLVAKKKKLLLLDENENAEMRTSGKKRKRF